MTLEAGRMIAHYRVGEKIGEGGMGQVYRAEDTKLSRDVALKVLPPAFAEDSDRMARFGREAQVLASLNHPNIGAIYGLEEAEEVRCLVLELIDGKTLADRIAEGPLPLEESLTIARQIAEALEAAHERGVIHRDLKPANVKVTTDGTVKVLDFGLAKALIGDTSSSDHSMSPTLTTPATHQGMILGTAAYMSPEQAKGHPADRRADIWAFGVVLHEMLQGGRLFSSDNISETLAAVLMKEPDLDELPGSIPPAIRRLLKRCLEKDSRDRLQAIGEARIAIDAYRAGPAAEDREPGAAPAATVAAPPRKLPWVVVGALGIALMAALFGLWRASRPAPAESMRLRMEVGPGQELDEETGAPFVLSPDGRLLVYVTDNGQGATLNLRSLDTLEGTPLSGTDGARAPFFSPDGKWIGFFTGTSLKKVSIAGGAPLTLAETATNRGGTWAADGTIVFSPDITSGLVRIPDTGGTPEPITELIDQERSHRWPAFLPDGEHVLFIAEDTGAAYDDSTIEVVHVDTKERTVIHEGGTYPRHLPTGHLAYVRDGTLFAAPFDTSRLELTGTPAPLLEEVRAALDSNTGDGTAHYSFSNNGTLVYMAGRLLSRQYSILWTDREGNLTPLLDEPRPYYAPRLSPDGTRLALQINSDAGSHIWVQDLERGVMTRLTFVGSENILPVWTLDGRRVAFNSTRDGKAAAYWTPSDGSGTAEVLWEDGRNISPTAFSPQGHVAVHVLNKETSWDLEVLAMRDGEAEEPQPFLITPSVEIFPEFSPDGRWIAYVSNESGQFEIYIRPYPGPGGKWQVSTTGGSSPRWTGNGRELIYQNRNQWFSVTVDADENSLRIGRPQMVMEGNFVDLSPFPSFDVTSDGQRFVLFPSDEADTSHALTHLNMILNWFDEVRRLAPSGT